MRGKNNRREEKGTVGERSQNGWTNRRGMKKNLKNGRQKGKSQSDGKNGVVEKEVKQKNDE